MEQFSVYQMFGFFQQEWSTILAILGIGTIYFLAPVLGYEAGRRGPLVSAMWAMIVKIGIGLFRTGLVVLHALADNGSFGLLSSPSRGSLANLDASLAVFLSLGESVVFMGAMILFVYGLQRLKRRPQPFPGS